MRLKRLDLVKYGRFSNVSLEFPAKHSDVHIIFGPNEAGKSTSLAAIEDLLFGIPHNSPYNFIHDYSNMRIGGLLEQDGGSLDVRRRKGNKDTLLGLDDLPLQSGDLALMSYLGGADQTFFIRMFSLNHERLARGGREILEAKDEVGQTLFAAGAGLSGLHDRIGDLKKEADGLWAPRRAAHRAYYKALDALEEADKALREHTITATKWQELKRAYESAQEAYGDLEKKIATDVAEQRKLNRVRRVYRLIRRLAELDKAIAAIGEVRLLPNDAQQQMEEASLEVSKSQSRIDVLTEQLNRAKTNRLEMDCDETLLLRCDDIDQLHKQRIEVQKEKVDLPRRQAELSAKRERLRDLSEELGWALKDPDDIAAGIPQRTRIIAVRTLLTQRGQCVSAKENAKESLKDVEEQIQELEGELDSTEGGLDVSGLAAVIKAIRETGDIDSRIRTAKKEVKDADAVIEKLLRPLSPPVVNEQVFVEVPVPPRSIVQDHRDASKQLEQQTKACHDRIAMVEEGIAQHRKAYQNLVSGKEIVEPEHLKGVRDDRDETWSLVRRRYIEQREVSEKEVSSFGENGIDLPTAYESKVKASDELADRRFDKAQAAGEIAAIMRQINDQQEVLQKLREEEESLGEASRALDKVWNELWDKAPFKPLGPDFMLDWLEARAIVLDIIERREGTLNQITALLEEESNTRSTIIAELLELGEEVERLKEQPVRIVLEAGTAVQRRHEKNAEHRTALAGRIRRLQADKKRKKTKLAEAESAWRNWQNQWSVAIKDVGLADDDVPEVVTDRIDTIDKMREVAAEINHLQHERIDKIERDIESFSNFVASLVGVLATDLTTHKSEGAALELERRLEEAKRIRDQQDTKEKEITSLKTRIGKCEEDKRNAQAALETLQEMAGVEEVGQLAQAIQKFQQRRKLDAERTSLLETLTAEGDDLPLAVLREECEAADLDKIVAREGALQAELANLRDGLTVATEQRAQARQVFEAIGGEDRAALAAAKRQEALATMQVVANQYIRVRTAATLLEWSIDVYRREKQAPLLKRAGQMFATLTLGSFSDLRVEFDDQDHAHLAGIRPDETSVSVGGMSDGTADQLYLALRLASVDEYLSRAHRLPFVADDLFINFDDPRAAAGFQVLAEMAQKTQVLFFTHHRHLVDIARETLGTAVNVIFLDDKKVASVT